MVAAPSPLVPFLRVEGEIDKNRGAVPLYYSTSPDLEASPGISGSHLLAVLTKFNIPLLSFCVYQVGVPLNDSVAERGGYQNWNYLFEPTKQTTRHRLSGYGLSGYNYS